ncbi:MAG TPA: hypothetical protein VI895_03655 [Bdellovibrionota bacterium]|nr:hypothetical protein [Bdellovibrionota bacterium]
MRKKTRAKSRTKRVARRQMKAKGRAKKGSARKAKSVKKAAPRTNRPAVSTLTTPRPSFAGVGMAGATSTGAVTGAAERTATKPSFRRPAKKVYDDFDTSRKELEDEYAAGDEEENDFMGEEEKDELEEEELDEEAETVGHSPLVREEE